MVVHWVPGRLSALVFEQEPKYCTGKRNLRVPTVVNEQSPGEAAISVQAEKQAGEFSQQNRQTFTQPYVNHNHTAALQNYQKAPFFLRAGSER